MVAAAEAVALVAATVAVGADGGPLPPLVATPVRSLPTVVLTTKTSEHQTPLKCEGTWYRSRDAFLEASLSSTTVVFTVTGRREGSRNKNLDVDSSVPFHSSGLRSSLIRTVSNSGGTRLSGGSSRVARRSAAATFFPLSPSSIAIYDRWRLIRLC